MSATLRELQERLAERSDPDEILEILDISSEELCEAFSYKIADKYNKLVEELFEDEEEEN